MRLHTLICIFGSIFVDHVTADGFDSDLPSPIKQLDAYNYEKTIKETKIILVEFFAPWVTVKIIVLDTENWPNDFDDFELTPIG